MGECKIKATCDELDRFLSTLSQPTIPSPEILTASVVTSPVHIVGDTSNNSSPTEAYRCKCSFQICADDNHQLKCVIRQNGNICQLPHGIFPPANSRIREAMSSLMDMLNQTNVEVVENNTKTTYKFPQMRENLTSLTFDTSWNEAECLVTMHYGPPGIKRSCFDRWKGEAKIICEECRFLRVTGRSKGVKLFQTTSNCVAVGTDESLAEEGIIQDTLWLSLRKRSDCQESIHRIHSVSLKEPEKSTDTLNVRIQYQKPATAFQHPNAGVMLTSLHWIINTLSNISYKHMATKPSDVRKKRLRLLEMYNGAGAHTIPLAKSMLLSDIVAVELDERLVKACINNCRLNNCLKSEKCNGAETLVDVIKGDAAEWAAKTLRCLKKKTNNNGSNEYNEFDILLVDPPRQGLDKTVCEMAIKGTFSHLIYISCGRRALIRDLELLCKNFFIEEMAVIDLFPGTDAVETLLHLKRK